MSSILLKSKTNRYFLKIIQLHTNHKTLIKKSLKKDREAQHQLFELFAPKMLSVCRYYIKDVYKAEEAMLNGFFKVFTKLNTYKNDGSFEGWIRRIMVREAITFLRREHKIEFSVEDIEVNHEYSNNIKTAMDVAQLQQLIDALPDGYKIVFIMYAIEGYKHHEIAEELNISVGTSKSQLFKARKLLQQQITVLNKTSYGTN